MGEEEKLHVGGDVDSWCSRCQLMLAHRVVAVVDDRPVMVECNACGTVHRYHPEPPEIPEEGRSVAREVWRTHDPEDAWRNLLASRREAGAPTVPYSVHAELHPGEIIEHPRFGIGVVIERHGVDRVEVRFRDEVRLLACGRRPVG